jgi:hypothetical protein
MMRLPFAAQHSEAALGKAVENLCQINQHLRQDLMTIWQG